MPSRVARGDRKLAANGCWRTLWSEERLVANLTATPRSGVRSGAERIPVFWTPSAHPSSSATMWYADFKRLCESCCTAVMQKSNTSYSFVFFSRSVLSCIRISARSLPCSQSGCCSFWEGDLQELAHPKQMFVWGG